MEFHFKNHLMIGFAGKRKHDSLHLVADKLTTLFKAIDAKLGDCEMHFFTGLADGSDQKAAAAFNKYYASAIKKQKKLLAAILPFGYEDYLNTIDDKENYKHLYNSCHHVLELDGKFIPDPTGEDLKNKAYRQQGSVLARLSDILIAVAPKSDSGKPGGSIETIITTLGLKKPVIFLNLDDIDPKFYLYQSIEEWFGKKEDQHPCEICNELFIADSKRSTFTIDDKQEKGWINRTRIWVWRWFEIMLKGRKQKTKNTENPPYNKLHEQIIKIQEKLDAQSVYFQSQYRGGYILNYALALIAIFLAVISLIIYGERPFEIKEFFTWSLFCFGLLKITILSILLVNTKEINKNEYNRKAIDYRFAAERLRVNSYMSLFGVLRTPAPSLGNHSRKQFSQYNGESIYQMAVFRTLCQTFNYVATKVDILAYLKIVKDEWIKGQMDYHHRESSRMRVMDGRLEKTPERMSKIVLWIVGFDLVVAFIVEIICPHLIGVTTRLFFDILLPYMLALTAFIPAIITTLNSIQFQSEAHRLSERSRLMHEELVRLDKKIDNIIEKITEDDQGSNFLSALAIVDETANTVIDEVAEWSMIYERRAPEL